eukprot:c18055_g1_i1 orf=156-2045(+)
MASPLPASVLVDNLGAIEDEIAVPSGWQRKLVARKGRGQTPKSCDVVYVAPGGEEIKSRTHLQRYLKAHPGGPVVSEFNWSSGSTPRRSARLTSKMPQPMEVEVTSKNTKRGVAEIYKDITEDEIAICPRPSKRIRKRDDETAPNVENGNGAFEVLQVEGTASETDDATENITVNAAYCVAGNKKNMLDIEEVKVEKEVAVGDIENSVAGMGKTLPDVDVEPSDKTPDVVGMCDLEGFSVQKEKIMPDVERAMVLSSEGPGDPEDYMAGKNSMLEPDVVASDKDTGVACCDIKDYVACKEKTLMDVDSVLQGDAGTVGTGVANLDELVGQEKTMVDVGMIVTAEGIRVAVLADIEAYAVGKEKTMADTEEAMRPSFESAGIGDTSDLNGCIAGKENTIQDVDVEATLLCNGARLAAVSDLKEYIDGKQKFIQDDEGMLPNDEHAAVAGVGDLESHVLPVDKAAKQGYGEDSDGGGNNDAAVEQEVQSEGLKVEDKVPELPNGITVGMPKPECLHQEPGTLASNAVDRDTVGLLPSEDIDNCSELIEPKKFTNFDAKDVPVLVETAELDCGVVDCALAEVCSAKEQQKTEDGNLQEHADGPFFLGVAPGLEQSVSQGDAYHSPEPVRVIN